jgi:hypothetical protein
MSLYLRWEVPCYMLAWKFLRQAENMKVWLAERAGIRLWVAAGLVGLWAVSATHPSVATMPARLAVDSTHASDSNGDANKIVKEIIQNEVQEQLRDKSLWMFKQFKETGGKKKLLAICQTKDGEIDRLLALDGRPLSEKERKSEDQRIERLITHPEVMRQQQRKSHEDGEQARKLLKMLPDAFVYKREESEGSITRFSFKPNSNFHPSGRASEVFHHMEGSMWLDEKQKRLVQISGKLVTEVRFGGGILGHLDKGGSFVVKQQDLGEGRWEVTTLNVEMNGKALFFKTIAVRERESDTDFKPVAPNMTLREAAKSVEQEGAASK